MSLRESPNEIDLPTEINRFREKLIDLTNRNRLLNYRKTKRKTLQIVDELPNQIYEHLILKGKRFRFDPLPEDDIDEVQPGSELALDKSSEVPLEALPDHIHDKDLVENRHKDDRLQTALTEKVLDSTLNYIRREATSAIEETGVNYLFLALGTLIWKDREDSSREMRAPLILIPVLISREFSNSRQKYEYSVSWREEELQFNLSLAKRLEKDFGLRLPELGDDQLPEDYFESVREAVTAKPTWSVHREALVGFFSFQKLLMYLDIDPANWSANGAMKDGSVLSQIVNGQISKSGPDRFASDYEIDKTAKADTIPLIADADSSQHSALIDIQSGKNLVIEGPPGTGKSQTICNAIAAAIYNGQKVLFVAEKLAALQVVSDKLSDRGLGEFCLKLHSDGVSPKKVYASLKNRIESHFRRPQQIHKTIEDIERKKRYIEEYLLAASTLVGPYREPLYEVLWRAIELRSPDLKVVDGYDFNTRISAVDYEENCDLLDAFSETYSELGSPKDSPWWGYWPIKADHSQTREISQSLEKLVAICDQLYPTVKSLSDLYGRECYSWLFDGRVVDDQKFVGLESMADMASRLPPEANVQILDSTKVQSIAREFIEVAGRANEQIRLTEPFLMTDRAQAESSAKRLLPLLEDVWYEPFEDGTIGTVREALAKLLALMAALTKFEVVAEELVSQGLGPIRNLKEFESAEHTFKLLRHPIVKNCTSVPKSLFLASSSDLYRKCENEGKGLAKSRDELSEAFYWPSLPGQDDIQEIARQLRPHVMSWFRIFNSDYRNAKRKLAQFWRVGIGKSAQSWLAKLEALEAWQISHRNYSEKVAYAETFIGLFRGLDTNWEDLETLLKWRATAIKHGLDAETANRYLGLRSASKLSSRDVSSANAELRAELADPLLSRILSLESVNSIRLDVIKDRAERMIQALTTSFELMECLNAPTELPIKSLLGRIKAICEASDLADAASDKEQWALLGQHYNGLDTNIASLQSVLNWFEHLESLALPIASYKALVNPQYRENSSELVKHTRAIKEAGDQWESVRSQFLAHGDIDVDNLSLKGTASDRLSVGDQLKEMLESLDDLPAWSGFSRSLLHCKQKGLTPFTDLALTGSISPSRLSDCFRLTAHERIAQECFAQSKSLVGFTRQKIEQTRKQYKELDQDLVRMNQALVSHELSVVDAPEGNSKGRVRDYTEMGLVENEINKQRSHCRIRDLLVRAGNAVQALKPCFMMSPLSISQFLAPDGIDFDIVVMDEASQIKPEDALGAVLRAKQLVVVGDPKQLPPTSFFDKIGEDVADEDATKFDNTESILEVASKAFQPMRRLRWHYRSQHETLIQFSNDRFYDDELIVFPSATTDASKLGLRFHHVPNATFIKGENLQEANAVAKAIVEHARLNPNETLGVGCFNTAQRDLIKECLDRLCNSDNATREVIAALDTGQENLFIKNLENLQGDERDVIFISYTYGPDPKAGKVFNRFGPITGDFGWRRLNVLITRARRRVEVFSSMQPDDIEGGPSKSLGVNAMKDYLGYVKHGYIPDRGVFSEREPDSPFEIAVARIVTKMGLAVVPQVGVAGYFIDLGVLRPGDSGDFLLGIECDGASYHSSKSARDRDRLRDEIICSRGWRIHRIWSTDWFTNQKHEENRLRNAIQVLLAGGHR